ncbi:MAG TPA: ribonuclease PH [Thermoanaerobaculia bacterium]|nr:ribonuclease PH [Thermoanaerobaculia bacterium]
MPPMTERPRAGGRAPDDLRPLSIELNPLKYAEGSALIQVGDTRVLAAASVEPRVPPFLRDSGQGWVTAEYSMLPRATSTRSQREVTRGRPSGRTAEIQRLIGRSLRAVVDMSALADKTITVDCDVLQADGGTRTASITAGYVALAAACARLLLTGDVARWPLVDAVAAVSAGLVGGRALLDLEYVEDEAAEVDMNVVATPGGRLIEIQGTGERRSFERRELDALVDLALAGVARLGDLQRQTLAGTLAEVEEVLAKGRRRPAPARPESELWGRP